MKAIAGRTGLSLVLLVIALQPYAPSELTWSDVFTLTMGALLYVFCGTKETP